MALQMGRAKAMAAVRDSRRPALLRAPLAPRQRRHSVACRCQAPKVVTEAAQKLVAAGAAALLAAGSLSGTAALASEFDVLAAPAPNATFYYDDAGVLSRDTRGELNKRLKSLENDTGYRVGVVTVRKLEYETDSFAFADKALEHWYPTVEIGNKKGLLLVVTTGKEGAVTGGPAFIKKVGEELIDSIISDNIPIYTEDEKYNQTVLSSIERIDAAIRGQAIPDAPQRDEASRKRTYLTKEETDKNKPVTGTIVTVFLVIAFVLPMVQYFLAVRE